MDAVEDVDVCAERCPGKPVEAGERLPHDGGHCWAGSGRACFGRLTGPTYVVDPVGAGDREHERHGTAGRARRGGSSVLRRHPAREAGDTGVQVASQHECERAVQSFVRRIAALDPELRRKHILTRTVSCRVPDLDLVFLARLDGDTIEELRCAAGADTQGAQVRLVAGSDDLVALLDGDLAPPVAWATGKLKIEASVLDLLRLRALL